jgi:hypothetical protein
MGGVITISGIVVRLSLSFYPSLRSRFFRFFRFFLLYNKTHLNFPGFGIWTREKKAKRKTIK